VNGKWTAEEVRELLLKIAGGPISVTQRVELFDIASNYASILDADGDVGAVGGEVYRVEAHKAVAAIDRCCATTWMMKSMPSIQRILIACFRTTPTPRDLAWLGMRMWSASLRP